MCRRRDRGLRRSDLEHVRDKIICGDMAAVAVAPLSGKPDQALGQVLGAWAADASTDPGTQITKAGFTAEADSGRCQLQILRPDYLMPKPKIVDAPTTFENLSRP
jgi:hypothetical protein